MQYKGKAITVASFKWCLWGEKHPLKRLGFFKNKNMALALKMLVEKPYVFKFQDWLISILEGSIKNLAVRSFIDNIFIVWKNQKDAYKIYWYF